jgi:branched-chain amino acid transport system ATP-binding protein
MTMLRVRDVTVRFGGIVALDHVSFDLNRGEILGLIGPNGAGKTTLFNCISGVIQPDTGSMYFDGRSLNFAPPHERARMGIARTFQNLQLWGSMTVQENVTVPMDALGRRNTLSDALYLPFSAYAERASYERARAILHVLELDRHVKTLAGDLPAGIQRRVEIARALAVRPQLLLLDEPAAGLDAGETEHLAELLRMVRERFHVSMLLVDHDMSLVLPVSDYVYVLDFGKVLAKGAPSAIQSDPKVIAAYLGEESKQPADTTKIVAAPSRDEPPLLEVDQLAAGYGHLEVIRDINLGEARITGGQVTVNGQPVIVNDQGVTVADRKVIPCIQAPQPPAGAPKPPNPPPPPAVVPPVPPLPGSGGSGSGSSSGSSGGAAPSTCVPGVDITYFKFYTVAPTKTIDGSHVRIWATGLHVVVTHPSPGPGVPTQSSEYVLGEGFADTTAGSGMGGFGFGEGFGDFGGFGGFDMSGAGAAGPGNAANAIGTALVANRVPLALMFLTLEALLLASAAAWVWARNTPTDHVPAEVLSP